MKPRRKISPTMRAKVFQKTNGTCWLSNVKIMPGDKWDVHHGVPLELGGADEFDNWWPVLRTAHREHTAKVDQPAIAKAQRVERKHIGAHQPRQRINPAVERQSDRTRGEKYSLEAMMARKAARQD